MKKLVASGISLATNWEKRLKLIFWNTNPKADTRKQNYPTGFLADGASALYERFAAGKISEWAEFPFAEHLNHRKVERANSPRNTKRKTRF